MIQEEAMMAPNMRRNEKKSHALLHAACTTRQGPPTSRRRPHKSQVSIVVARSRALVLVLACAELYIAHLPPSLPAFPACLPACLPACQQKAEAPPCGAPRWGCRRSGTRRS